jgi:predicted DNA-binding protein (MmcQ/YjbR family)
MNADSIRAYCLSFPHTKEKLQWGESLCFKVGEKIFAILSLDLSHGTRLVFKCAPEIFAELIEREGIRPSPYVGRYHWAALERLDVLPNHELEDLIRQSYEIVAAKAIKKGQRTTTTKTGRKTPTAKKKKSVGGGSP